MSSTFEAFTPLTETWGLLNSGRPTQRLAVATSQKVKICNLQLAPTQHHTTFETMIFEKRDSYFCSHLCSSPILNPQLAEPPFYCFHSKESFHTSHVLPMTMFQRTKKHFPHRRSPSVAADATRGIFLAFSLWKQDYFVNVCLKLFLAD